MAGLLWFSTIRVADEHVALVAGRGGAAPKILTPGFHLVRPGTRAATLPAGPCRFSGSVPLTTTEGARLEVPYGVLLDLRAAEPPALAGFIDRSAGSAVQLVLEGIVARQPGLRSGAIHLATVERELAALGAIPGSLTLGPAMPAAGLPPPAHPLRGAPGVPRARVVVIGLDGADWDLMEPMIQAGELPHLAALRARGAWGTLRSMQPMLSPLLWTTVATGRRPEEHGVMDFLMVDPATGRESPISRAYRKVKALWNITSDLDLTSLTVGWWATWPAERVFGAMITERVAYSLFHLPMGERRIGATWPPALLERLEPLILGDDAIGWEDLKPIAAIPAARFEKARRGLGGAQALADPVSHLIRILASTRSYAAIASALLARHRPDLSMIYFEGIDQVNHRFAHFLPPALSMTRGTEPSLAEAFQGAIPGFYRLQDRIIGELLDAAGPECVVLVISDHGFANGAERPVDSPPDIEGRPGLWHTMDGVLIAAGPGIRRGKIDDPMQMLDMAPTILAMLGLPAAQDMPGRAIPGLFEPEPATPASSTPIASYDSLGAPLQGFAPQASTPADAEMLENLRALGYIQSGADGSASGGGTPTYHINAGHLFLQRGDPDRAQREFEEARRLAPRFDQPLLGLAQVELARGRPAAALPHLEAALRISEDPRPSLYTRAAQVYLRAGRGPEGIVFMESVAATGRREAFRLAALGILKDAGGDSGGALAAWRASLELDPGVERSLQGAYLLLRQRGDLEELARLLAPSLSAESPVVAARAANWLALTREAQARQPEAIAILTGTLAKQPEDVMTLVNLGSMLLSTDRAAEGLALLEKAHQAQPRSVEVITNLIVGHGRAGNLHEARRYFGEAEKQGLAAREPSILNAIAYACSLSGKRDAARDYLNKSLALDPRQPAARELLSSLSGH